MHRLMQHAMHLGQGKDFKEVDVMSRLGIYSEVIWP
jgi:hypothetical protein